MESATPDFTLSFFLRGECTDTLRRRITDLETECKKLTMDIKLKEDQIRELELKVQVCYRYLPPLVSVCLASSAFVKFVDWN